MNNLNNLFRGIKVFNDIENINEKSHFFLENDYLLLKNVLTDEIKQFLYENVKFDMPIENKENPIHSSVIFYSEHSTTPNIVGEFNEFLLPIYKVILNIDLTPFLGFSMKYNKTTDVLPHYDNYNMPISSTICFRNEDRIEYPIYIDKAYFNNPHPFRITIKNRDTIPIENILKFDLNEGDILIFRGRNHLHWRDNIYVKDYRAILLHTEDYTYNGKLISYVHPNKKDNADIQNIKNIDIRALTFIDSYETFRKDYVMHFKNS
jgi:hypothetical protein